MPSRVTVISTQRRSTPRVSAATWRSLAAILKGALMLYFRISGTNDKAPEAILLEAAIKQICRDAGFKQVRIGHMYTGDDWKEQLALVNGERQRPMMRPTNGPWTRSWFAFFQSALDCRDF